MAYESDVPPQLRRVIVPAGWDEEQQLRLQQLSERRSLVVEVEAA